MKRRDFLVVPPLAAGLALADHPLFANRQTEVQTAMPPQVVRIDSPYHGAVLHRRLKEPVVGAVDDADGKPLALKITVRGIAPIDAMVKVNGVTARRIGDAFLADIPLRHEENTITAEAFADETSLSRSQVRVWWLKHSFPRYRFTVDDTIYCLREVHRKKYKSLFNDEFLGNMRKLNRKYGVKVALNLFYESHEEEGFRLSDFSDRYKSEWRDNADWLRLLFHAKTEFPAAPYQNATPGKLAADFMQVEHEIKRFAGEETYLPATVIHFGEVRPDTYATLAALGVTTLSGYFLPPPSRYPVNYQIDEARNEYLGRHDFLVDFDSGIVFSKMDAVLNLVPLDRIVPTLEAAMSDPNTAEFIDLMTHEQYFWPFYKNYIPDHWERLDRAFALVTERGYKPVFLNAPLLGVDD